MSFGDSSALSWEGATDMESLRAMIAKAETGTGEIARCIELAKFRPGQAAFTNLLQVRLYYGICVLSFLLLI